MKHLFFLCYSVLLVCQIGTCQTKEAFVKGYMLVYESKSFFFPDSLAGSSSLFSNQIRYGYQIKEFERDPALESKGINYEVEINLLENDTIKSKKSIIKVLPVKIKYNWIEGSDKDESSKILFRINSKDYLYDYVFPTDRGFSIIKEL